MRIELSSLIGRASLSRLRHLVPRLASLVLIALMAWLLADTTFSLMAPSYSDKTEQERNTNGTLEPKALEDASLLFGLWGETPESSEIESAEVLEETTLPLSLIGVFVSDDTQASGAIIASGQGAGRQYQIGDKIPGNATLESVQVDSIMIRRGARLERLSFERSASGEAVLTKSTATPAAPSPHSQASLADESTGASTSSQHAETSSLGEKMEEYRSLAKRDPRGALNQLGLQEVGNDGDPGYQVGALPDNEWVRQSGLQNGDILLSVNGRNVGNPDIDRLELDNLFAEGEVRLEIQRGGRRFFVSTKLSP